MSKPHIIVEGMQGLGDNLHQRALIRTLMRKYVVWLRTPWPSVYHDLVGPGLRLMKRATALRTQVKNQVREASNYTTATPPQGCDVMHISYTHEGVRTLGSFLAAMAYQSNVLHVDATPEGFHLPIPGEWRAKAEAWIERWEPTKPLMMYRPLVERSEWKGNAPRNPDPAAYVNLANAISGDFFVVGVADLSPGVEWATSAPINMDAECLAGELDFETMAALFSMSDLVFTAPGFGLVLGQAVGARTVGVFGGHESARFYDHGVENQYWIEPTNPCECFSKTHNCDKHIPFSAKAELKEFLANCEVMNIQPWKAIA